MIDRPSVFLLAIVLGAGGIWLSSPHAPSIRQRRIVGRILAILGLLLLIWQLSGRVDGISGVLSLIVSIALPAAAVASIIAEQAQTAAGCFALMLLALVASFLLIGAWPMAFVVVALSGVAYGTGNLMPSANKQSWCRINRETHSWEPMLSSATGAVVVGVLAMPVSRGFGDASPTTHNMAMAGVLLLGIGLVGLVSRISAARMFLAVGVMLAGAAVAAFAWIGQLDIPLDGAALPIAIVAGMVGGMWIAACMLLLLRRENESDGSPLEQSSDRLNMHLYALLTAMGFVVLTGFLRMGG